MSCENCARLQAEIERLKEELRDAYDSASQAEERATAASEKARRATSEAARIQRESQDAEYFREDQLKAVNRAREIGDEHAEAKALERLKRGW